MARRPGRSEFAQEAVGFLLANYLRLVQATSRRTTVPADLDAHIAGRTPLIAAMWHGQHLMTPLARPATMGPLGVLISRHEDAGAQANAAQRLGIEPIRGSGRARRPAILQGRCAGAAPTAASARFRLVGRDDGRRSETGAGRRSGIATLAKLSGRPIVPTAVVTSRRMQFDTWDRATLGLPFSRAVVVVGDFIEVAPDADDAALERTRLAVQDGLDEAHRRAYAMVGATDPGAGLRTAQLGTG